MQAGEMWYSTIVSYVPVEPVPAFRKDKRKNLKQGKQRSWTETLPSDSNLHTFTSLLAHNKVSE